MISDSPAGLVEAARKQFQGVFWQRCQVHLMRNLLSHTPSRYRAEVATHAKRIFQAHDTAEARMPLATFVARFEKSAPGTVTCLEDGFEDALSVIVLPEKYRKGLRTTNTQERLNEEIRSFSDTGSALRLVGALLAEHHEAWAWQHDLDRDELHEWLAARHRAAPSDNGVSLS